MKVVKTIDVIVVGAGSAGIGVAVVLKRMGINFQILEKEEIGASFKKWPEETQFISPSFTGNFFKMPDLNAITPETSPAFNLLTEHPTGEEYQEYLETVSEFYKLDINTGVTVETVHKKKGTFIVMTNKGEYHSQFLIWAAGEYQYPDRRAFKGSELCMHYSDISSFEEIKTDERIVIGAYESGCDAAINLCREGTSVTLLDRSNSFELVNSDSSYSLSPFTRDRLIEEDLNFEYKPESGVKEVRFDKGKYVAETVSNKQFISSHKPINCTGFTSSLSLIESLFETHEGYPILNNFDESTKTKNLFLVGPQVKHGNALFCFIYKYRQRFSIVANRIAVRNKIDNSIIKRVVQDYKDANFYLKDLACCDGECVC
ncbi:monooxygenase [Candidatus Marinamargulisbacteria bacterium SCGC AG-343-D04]|nr:monooxygenase [Candidatus Marinamargulisbacteria bacterium SCGC AG-343-D04]